MKKLFYIFLDTDGVFWDYKWLKEEINARKFFKNHSTIKTNIYENSLSLEMVKNALKSLKNGEKSEEN